MLQLGNYNTLPIVRFTDHGAMLDAGEIGEILMPRAFVEPAMRVGDEVRVLVYLDQEERLVATRERALACVGDFAYLRVSWVNRFGAFLHWGPQKDLFCPFREQRQTMERDRRYLVRIYVDEETGRLVASAKLERFLEPARGNDFPRAKAVELLVWQRTPMGYKVIVDGRYAGMLYDSDLLRPVRTGERLAGSVVTCRPDGKLDVAVGSIGKQRFRDFADQLRTELTQAGGSLPFTDSSSADDINARFGVSKKTFKRAVGTLYKAQEIDILPTAIQLRTEKKK